VRRLGLLSLLLVATLGHTAQTYDVVPIVRVEEDWAVEIDVPDPDGDAPQIINVISPEATADGIHAVFELNHSTQPDYVAGGMQLQLWDGGAIAAYDDRIADSPMQITGEVVTYTMRMSLYNGYVWFSVRNGVSQTWGTFGGTSSLRISAPSDLQNLNAYNPDLSAGLSRVGFASYRVTRYVLKQVRYYSSTGLVATDTTERVAFQHPNL
jgi:hypothetical protein